MEFNTPYLLLNVVIFIAGLAVLIKGSDWFIEAAAGIARKYNVSELTIGLTLVSIGTALPEWASSLYAAFANHPEFIVGNIVGSITTNITLILGIGVVFCGCLFFSRKLLTRDVLIMFGVFLLTAALVFAYKIFSGTYQIGRIGGGILTAIAVWYCWHLFRQPEQETSECELEEAHRLAEATRNMSFVKCFGLLFLGLVMVVLGSKAMLDTVVWSAAKLGVPTIVISMTVVAFGSSVPELAVTIAGVTKKCHDMALGNVIGSNTFNILLIFGTCSLVRPVSFGSTGAGMVNLGIMLVAGAALVALMYVCRDRLKRSGGILLLTMYAVFLAYNCRHFFGA
jgi:cation:H+ antiporter